jgi:hypothetical protein
MTRGLIINRRRFLRASAVAAGIGAGVGLYTWRWEPHWLELVERRLQVAKLPDRLAGSRLAQLSDLHVGPRVDDSYLIRAFKRVKELAPEIVDQPGYWPPPASEIQRATRGHRVSIGPGMIKTGTIRRSTEWRPRDASCKCGRRGGPPSVS